MKENGELCCECGHKLRRQGRRWNGVAYISAIYDDDPQSPTYLGRITHCPSCGEALGPWTGRERKEAHYDS